jgi:hypothetical protein
LLKADLLSLTASSENQIAAHMMLMAEKTHEPSRAVVEQFARDLVRSRLSPFHPANPVPIPETRVDALVAEIDSIFKSAGTSTVGFHEHVEKFERVMINIGTTQSTAHKLAATLETIGRQVRGPEDTPAR